ncbi:MAG: hypothetical protein AAB845_03455, partial [Patescibacteria group bacterium]
MIGGEFTKTIFLTPEFQYSLDNAAMIGTAALMRYAQMNESQKESLRANAITMEPNPNLPLQPLT